MKISDLIIPSIIIAAFLHILLIPSSFKGCSCSPQPVDYTTHYAKGDTINYAVVNLINTEKYEEKQ